VARSALAILKDKLLGRTRPTGAPRPPSFRPGLESLDDRLVPSTIPNLTNAQFALNVSGRVAQLQVQAENTATGQFIGLFTDSSAGIATTVLGTVGAEAAGGTTAGLSFFSIDRTLGSSGSVSFGGTLTGPGTGSGYFGTDQLSVSGVEFRYIPGFGTLPTVVSVTGNDQGILDLTNAHFANLAYFNGYGGALAIQSEDTTTGRFAGTFTNAKLGPEGVSGQLARPTAMQNGNPVDGLSFHTVSGAVAFSFTGTVTGPGTHGRAFGSDSMAGTLSFSNPNPAPGQLGSFAGSATGNDQGSIPNLLNVEFWLAIGGTTDHAILTVLSENADGTFAGSYFDAWLDETFVVRGSIGRAYDMQNGQPIATLTFSGDVGVVGSGIDAEIETLSFSGTVNGPGAFALASNRVSGTEWFSAGSQVQTFGVVGWDV
jgi:hypothetical protein